MQFTAQTDAGFADPVHDAQRTFRAIMNAMAAPGTIQRIGAGAAREAVVLTLCDVTTPVWIDAGPIHRDPGSRPGRAESTGPAPPPSARPGLEPGSAARDTEDIARWLSFHTGAPVTDQIDQARFALIRNPATMPPLTAFAEGDDRYPDRSATLILECATLSEGEGLIVEGPGIEIHHRLNFAPTPKDLLNQWAANNSRFPRGVDLILTSDDQLAALPRTVRITGESA